MPKALVVVAHPDDEAIFFFRTIRDLSASGHDVTVVCATNEFDTTAATTIRMAELQRSCDAMKVERRTLEMQDLRDKPLSPAAIEKQLRDAVGSELPDVVYTHSPWGDYGHLHHIAVSIAAHEAFGDRVLSLAQTVKADSFVRLTLAQDREKRLHAASVYRSQPFATRWCTSTESFRRLDLESVRFLARFVPEYAPADPIPRLEPEDPRLVAAADLHEGLSTQFGAVPTALRHIITRVWARRLGRYWGLLHAYMRTPRLTFLGGGYTRPPLPTHR